MPYWDARPAHHCTRRQFLITGLTLTALVAACGTSSKTVPPPLDPEARARDLLRRRPFAPSDIDIFDSWAYPESRPSLPAAGAARSVDRVDDELRAVLENRPNPAAALAMGRAAFTSEVGQRIVSDVRLRGGLAVLAGTLGEGAIPFYLESGNWERVCFGPLDSSTAIAQAITLPAESHRTIIVNERYQDEPLQALAPVLLHEALHHDDLWTGEMEELTAYALHTLVYAQIVRDQPAVAARGSELVRVLNTDLLARLNSGHPDTPELRIFAQDNQPILPGSNCTQVDFASFFRLTYAVATRGNPLLTACLAALAGPGVALPEAPRFDIPTLTFIDENLNAAVLGAADLIAVARALRLIIPGQRTTEDRAAACSSTTPPAASRLGAWHSAG